MNAPRGNLTEASKSWLSSLFLCCGRTSAETEDYTEKGARGMVHEQPVPYQQPILSAKTLTRQSTRGPRQSFSSGRISLSGKRRHRSDLSSRRTVISQPSDFRHLGSGSFQFPPFESDSSPSPSPPPPRTAPELRNSAYRPLELRICMPEHHLSPIIPHFDFDGVFSTPPPAYDPRNWDDEHRLVHRSSQTSIPFHVPRRQITAGYQGEEPPVPMPFKPARGRAYTSPEVETLKERVAGAMIEMERLQKQIDDVIERQSLHAVSRPSTSGTMTAERHRRDRPWPAVPALPPAAPSFAERLHSDIDRPQTAPLESVFSATDLSPGTNATNKSSSVLDQAGPASPTLTNSPADSCSTTGPLPPPLPLVLRPPLRKKKSFSRVSTWLFPAPNGQQHERSISLESVTNFPRPVKGDEGFYQCLPPGGVFGRTSPESPRSEAVWETDDDRTAPTTQTAWSHESTPQSKPSPFNPLERTGAFGTRSDRPCIVNGSHPSVGLAV